MPAAKEKQEKSVMLYREATIDVSALKADSREIELSFASEQPVERWDWDSGCVYLEVLDHSSAKSADFSRLNNGGALLRDHDRRVQTGVVVRGTAKVRDDKKSGCTVKFSRSPIGEQELQDVKDGIRTLVSVGYNIGRELSREKKDGVEVRKFEWSAFEISIVSIPADNTVGVGREQPAPVDSARELNIEEVVAQATTEQKARMKILLDPAAKDTTGGAPAKTELQLERERVKEISATAELLIKDHGTRNDGKMAETIRGMANEAIGLGETSDKFKMRCMEDVLKAAPAKQVRMADLGFDEQEIRSYSLVRAIQNCLTRKSSVPDAGTLEGEAHARMLKLDLGAANKTNGFLVPADANISARSLSRDERRRMQRDLQVNVFGQGGATVATELQMPIIEILRNEMVTDQLGIQVLAGLQGNIAIPRQTAAATAYSVPELGLLTLSTQALDQIALAPRRVGAVNRYSKQLLLQSSMDVENFVRTDLLAVIGLDWDRLILNGQGANSEPLGIMNTPGIGSIIFGAAATFAKLVAMETAIAALNAPRKNRAYASTSTVKGVLKSAAKLLVGATTVAAQALWENDQINGYPAIDSQQVPNNQMIFGAWSEIILGLWGGYDVVIDPYSLAKNAEVEITMNTWGDVAIRHPQSFCVSADNANQ